MKKRELYERLSKAGQDISRAEGEAARREGEVVQALARADEAAARARKAEYAAGRTKAALDDQRRRLLDAGFFDIHDAESTAINATLGGSDVHVTLHFRLSAADAEAVRDGMHEHRAHIA